MIQHICQDHANWPDNVLHFNQTQLSKTNSSQIACKHISDNFTALSRNKVQNISTMKNLMAKVQELSRGLGGHFPPEKKKSWNAMKNFCQIVLILIYTAMCYKAVLPGWLDILTFLCAKFLLWYKAYRNWVKLARSHRKVQNQFYQLDVTDHEN